LNKTWQFRVDAPQTGIENLTLDHRLFQNHEFGPEESGSILRFYSWVTPTISFGYSQAIEDLVDSQKAKQLGIECVKRITGGGMVFHQPGELTYCLIMNLDDPLLPRGLMSSFNFISEIIIRALNNIGVKSYLASKKGVSLFQEAVCFSRPTRYEILANNKKLVGSAQKRGKRTLMQHGSIAIDQRLTLFDQLINIKSLKLSQIAINDLVEHPLSWQEVAKPLLNAFKETFYQATGPGHLLPKQMVSSTLTK